MRGGVRRVEGGSGLAGAGAAPGARPLGSPVPRLWPGLAALRASPPWYVSASFLSLSLSVSWSLCFCPSLPWFCTFLSLLYEFPWVCASACIFSLGLSVLPLSGVFLCMSVRLPTAQPQIQTVPRCRSSRDSFLDREKEAKPSPYRPPAPGAWPGSSPWN